MNTTGPDQQYLKSLTVLYVEDDDDTRSQFTRFLERLVGRLVVAANGAEGLTAFMEHRPQLVITDILMPVMDGLTMAREIRELDRTAQIIVLTAFEQLDYLKNSINIGVNKYVTKPVNGFQLHAVMLECAAELRAHENLAAAARTDQLTGLANRRELEIRFEAEKGRAVRHAVPFSVIIADIDHFKQINDTYSHLAGDQVLKQVAETFNRCIRTEDCCGRWGGEEFVVLLAETDREAAALVAEKLRLAVSNQTTDWQGEQLRVTISLGVTSYRPGMDSEECISQADEAMYRAKAAGRNRVVVAEA